MALSLPASLAGSTVPGLTSPSFTLTAGNQNALNERVYNVTAVTNGATGSVHTASLPFSIKITRPKDVATVPPVSPGGVRPPIPKNQYVVSLIKGVQNDTLYPKVEIILCRATLSVPAGVDLLANNLDQTRVAASCFGSVIATLMSGLVSTTIDGVF